MENFKRRTFIKTGLVAVAGVTAISSLAVAWQQPTVLESKVCVFSKCLQFLNYRQMAEKIVELGFDGVDLTVRKNGHVLPENAKEGLPAAANELQKVGKSIQMIATDIVDPNDQITEDILSTASSLGIKYYRLGRFIYNRSKSIFQNLNDYKQTLDKLEKLSRRYKMHACIQNHSGPFNMVGAPVWDLHYLLKDIDPEFIGIQYDIMHATAEGGYSWHLGLELMAPWIKTIDIKDFIWERDKSGKWKTKIVPLGEGMVDFSKFVNDIKRLKIKAEYSIHFEYDLGGAELGNLYSEMEQDEIYQKIKKDLSLFRTFN